MSNLDALLELEYLDKKYRIELTESNDFWLGFLAAFRSYPNLVRKSRFPEFMKLSHSTSERFTELLLNYFYSPEEASNLRVTGIQIPGSEQEIEVPSVDQETELRSVVDDLFRGLVYGNEILVFLGLEPQQLPTTLVDRDTGTSYSLEAVLQ